MKALDWFVEAFGAAVADVREKVINEPWFGRDLNPPQPPSLAAVLGWAEGRPGDRLTVERPAAEHSTGHDLDR